MGKSSTRTAYVPPAQADPLMPRLGFLKLDAQVDLTQHRGDLLTCVLVTYIGHRLPIAVSRIGNLRSPPRSSPTAPRAAS